MIYFWHTLRVRYIGNHPAGWKTVDSYPQSIHPYLQSQERDQGKKQGKKGRLETSGHHADNEILSRISP